MSVMLAMPLIPSIKLKKFAVPIRKRKTRGQRKDQKKNEWGQPEGRQSVIRAQLRQQRKQANQAGNELDDETEFHRNPQIIPVEADSGEEDHGEEEGRWHAQGEPCHDEGCEDPHAAAPGRRFCVCAAPIRHVEQVFPKRHSGNQPGAHGSQAHTGQKQQGHPVAGDLLDELSENGYQIIRHKSPDCPISSTVSRQPAAKSYSGIKPSCL